MKNKEIEELLNELKRRKERYDYCKNNDISFSDEDYNSYLLLSYIEQLEQENQQLKKQKDDVVIKYIKYLIKRLEEFDILERKETGAFWYQVMGELKELLRMLGEIE